MASVEINYENFSEIQKHIQTALDKMTELETNWDTYFASASTNVNEKLTEYYDDQKTTLDSAIVSDIIGGSDTSTGGARVTQKGIINGLINDHGISIRGTTRPTVKTAFEEDAGIYFIASGEVTLKTTAKDALTTLIDECVNGTHAYYTSLTDLKTKLENVKMALQLVLFKIAEYQSNYANLQTTVDEIVANGGSNISLNLSADGVLLGINTTITIDGQDIQTDTSSAMNAFFTYSNTFMNAEIEAAYLESNGATIDYKALVSNTNAFMTDTIESGLYSNTFITAVLPTHTEDLDAAYDAATAATKLDLDSLKSVLDNNKEFGGDLALYGGLLGVSLLGPIGNGSDPQTPSGDTPTTSLPGDTGTPSGPSSSGTTGSSVITPTPTPSGSEDEKDKDKEEDKDKEDDKGEEKDSKLEEIVELEDEIPEEVKADFGETDYDQLARDNYEFGTSIEDIIAHRNELIEEFQKAYETGDLTSLELKLKKYGFNEAEIEAILDDRFMCYKALLEGDERSILAESAMELAAADGVEDYESHWADRPNFDDLSTDGPSDLLTLSSTDDNIRQLKTDCDTAKENYQTVVDETNTMLKEVSDNKAKIQEIKEKYDKEFGEDTTKWSSEAVTEYNDAVKTYNESVNKVPEQMTKLDEAKTAYDDSVTKFTTAKEEYYKKLKEDSDPSQYTDEDEDLGSENNLPVTDDGSSQGDGVIAGDNNLGVGTGDGTGSQVINMGDTNNITSLPTDDNSDDGSSDGVVVSNSGIGFSN